MLFTGLPKEYHIPQQASVIFVQDFFASELIGGAELTSDAIIKACPVNLFQMHSHSLTEALVKKNKHKTWIFGNQTQVPPHILALFPNLGIRYFFFEYDFKPCVFRSTIKHAMSQGKCECHLNAHGKFMSQWMTHSKGLFWCSQGQKDKFYNLYPELKDTTTPNFIQGSTFYSETILNIRKVRERKERGELVVQDRWCILDSDSWIKGTSDAVEYCKQNNMSYVLLKNLSNEQFLTELAQSKGLVFFPRDIDVGSRITVECKLLGGQPTLNDFVLVKFEPWFNGTVEEVEQYFLDGPERFWRCVDSVKP